MSNMKIKLTTTITGSIDQTPYPPAGVPFLIAANIGQSLCDRGLAVPVRTDLDAELRGTEKLEHATPPESTEVRSTTRVSKSHEHPTEIQHTDVTSDSEDKPVKRGPGRPRKNRG